MSEEIESNPTRVDHVPPQKWYVTVQRGAARLGVVPLPPGGRLTVGRSSSNHIVVQDKKCSREHCELFLQHGFLYVRDLGSRNGVTIDREPVEGDRLARAGNTIGVGDHTLLLSLTHPDEITASEAEEEDGQFSIVERKTGTMFDLPSGVQRVESLKQGAAAAAQLFQIARDMQSATKLTAMCEQVLQSLFRALPVTIGGILLAPDRSPIDAARLTVVAAIPRDQTQTANFSSYLTRIALDEREAILAHDIPDHASLSQRESLSELQATSALVVPIRDESRCVGVVHLYSTNAANPLNGEHLEFVLAVCDQMAGPIRSIREREELAKELDRQESLSTEYRQQLEIETELIGNSPELHQLKQSIGRVAPTDATVLIRGESGVGKELVARAVHFNSTRREGPFVCVNCAALTESLLESELFGHEKGAFTGAAGQKAGKFEQADGGTLFLDEIGEMSQEIQAKFLRVLEGQAFERVGGGKAINVDVRVVTATNRNLEDAVRAGQFRSDLFFRLQVIELDVPPLRQHPADIPLIAQHFIERYSRKSRTVVKGLGDEARHKLMQHPWPGNVRELRNVIERAVILSDRELLTPADIVLSKLQLDPPSGATVSAAATATDPADSAGDTLFDPQLNLFASFLQQGLSMEDVERLYMEAALNLYQWNKSQASRVLGIERTTLDRRLKKYGMQRPDGSSEDD